MYGFPRTWPLGLGGFGAAMATADERVTEVQDEIVRHVDGWSPLRRQATYQYLNGLGHRMPSDPHGELLRLAKKES